jgi:hypothetical protein
MQRDATRRRGVLTALVATTDICSWFDGVSEGPAGGAADGYLFEPAESALGYLVRGVSGGPRGGACSFSALGRHGDCGGNRLGRTAWLTTDLSAGGRRSSMAAATVIASESTGPGPRWRRELFGQPCLAVSAAGAPLRWAPRGPSPRRLQ